MQKLLKSLMSGIIEEILYFTDWIMEKKDDHPYIWAFIAWVAIGIIFSMLKFLFEGD